MRGRLKERLKWEKGNRQLLADELPTLLRTNTRLVPSHSPFPTAESLVDPPTRSVSEEKAECWFTNMLIAFCEPSISGSHHVENGDAVLAIGLALLWRTDRSSAGYHPTQGGC